MKKRIISFFLALVVIMTILPAYTPGAEAAGKMTETEVIAKLKAAESKWKNGSRYIDRMADGVGTCFGFGREIFQYVFDAQLPTLWSVSDARFKNKMQNITEIGHLNSKYSLNDICKLLSKAKPGDILVGSNGKYNHLVMVRSAKSDGSAISVYDANWAKENGKPLIRTNGTWSASGIRKNRPIAVTLYRYKNYDLSSSNTPHITHVKGEFRFYGKSHPHYNYYKCSVCGELFTDGTKVNMPTCETCNPKPAHTTHEKGAYKYYGASHPHYRYFECSVCGEIFTDGTTSKMPTCKTCYPESKSWGPWSDWSTTKVTASSTRQVETRKVQTAAAYTQYRYGRYVDSTGKHDCWCGKYLEGLGYGKASLQYSSWSTARYGATGKGWTCGKCNASHIGVGHYGSDGRPWWAEYKLPNGSYYWEESRTVPAVYVTQYRYRDFISNK